ncbi:MAG: hypothetical protein HRT60_11105 [Dinoroseobacter sp.]|nr:hypothetical protein [Dinoroseobacter sp.]
MKHSFAIALPLIAASIAVMIALPAQFGAHPQWTASVLLIGAPAGIFLGYFFFAMRLPKVLRVIFSLAIAGAAYYLARDGQKAFIASFSEDKIAGQLWFFGWIIVCAGCGSVLASLALSPTNDLDSEAEKETLDEV